MSYCLGVFPRRQAKYLRSMIRENPNSTVYVVLRGRGSRKEHGNSQDLPIKHADKVAMYVRPKQKASYNGDIYLGDEQEA